MFWIISYCPWLILIIIAGFVVYIICHLSNNNSSPNSTAYNNINNTPQTNNINYSEPIYNSELAGFKAELQENTKTPQQVNNENWLKEKEQITKEANRDFKNIKQKLLDKAKTGQYSVTNGQRYILLAYNCPYLLNCVNRQYFRNPTGKLGTSSYKANERAYYHIDKIKQYDLYLFVIRELATQDSINIIPFFTEMDIVHNKENKITLPYTYTHQWNVSSHKIKAYLICSIHY